MILLRHSLRINNGTIFMMEVVDGERSVRVERFHWVWLVVWLFRTRLIRQNRNISFSYLIPT